MTKNKKQLKNLKREKRRVTIFQIWLSICYEANLLPWGHFLTTEGWRLTNTQPHFGIHKYGYKLPNLML